MANHCPHCVILRLIKHEALQNGGDERLASQHALLALAQMALNVNTPPGQTSEDVIESMIKDLRELVAREQAISATAKSGMHVEVGHG